MGNLKQKNTNHLLYFPYLTTSLCFIQYEIVISIPSPKIVEKNGFLYYSFTLEKHQKWTESYVRNYSIF